MKKNVLIKLVGILGAFALFVGLTGFAVPVSHPFSLQPAQPVYAAGNHLLYLPLMTRDYQTFAAAQTIFGIQMDSLDNNSLNLAAAAKANWVGGIPITWSSVEPNQGNRIWSSLATQEQAMRDVVNKGLTPIVNVRFTPAWAQLFPGYSCGPMKASNFDEFASFMHDAVARYSKPPYNIKYWEIWNEEDIDHTLPGIDPNSPYGCWGNSNDTYNGGGYYADMLKVVYPQIKSADPQAQVLVGGLLLDCDPRANAGCAITGHPSVPAMFLEGILRNGGGPYFDGISYHGYDYYQGNNKHYYNPNWQSTWNTTGPVSIAKANFIKGLLNTYSVTGKFLINTESAVICMWDGCNTADFEAIKAYYAAEVNAAAIALGLRGNLWFSWLGWNNSGLYPTSLPAYKTFQFSSGELRNTVFSRNITEFTGVKGYELSRSDRRIWVIWSSDGSTHTASLPSKPLAAYHINSVGNAVSDTPSTSVQVTSGPVFLEWNP